MSLHTDLLIQAAFLSRREPKRPRQASLRRAISAAYYALFHLLTNEASRQIASDRDVIAVLNRAYAHQNMAMVSKAVSRGDFPRAINPLKAKLKVPAELQSVAKAFVELQQARYEADYNVARKFTRNEAMTLVSQAEQAFDDWGAIRRDHYARLYVGCFLMWDAWDRFR